MAGEWGSCSEYSGIAEQTDGKTLPLSPLAKGYNGQTLPFDGMTVQDVVQLQEMLDVTPDGKWGKQSQAAWEEVLDESFYSWDESTAKSSDTVVKYKLQDGMSYGAFSEVEDFSASTKCKNVPPWNVVDTTIMIAERKKDGVSQHLIKYKNKVVESYAPLIKKAAQEFDIPPYLLAATCWIEAEGDPTIADPVAFSLRNIGISVKGVKDPYKTSFGYVSMQVAVAAETLGINPKELTKSEAQGIIRLLANPKTNIYIAAKHLSDLRNIDAPGKSASQLTENDVRIIGTRYNRGGSISLEQVWKNTSYGDDVLGHRERVEKLLEGYENSENEGPRYPIL